MINKESIKAGIGAGFLGSLCCTTPLLIVGLGLGSFGFAMSFSRYRPFFVILGIVFLTFSIYRYVKKKEGSCTLNSLKKNTSTIVVAVLIATLIWYLLIYVIAPFLGRFVF